jgi:prepilin-type N-terminal cleavage/methylation domain-containing protein
MKRSGFTMIELIFVIVILGILASVAIPKLAATRDDAKISKASSEISTLVSDLGTYYTGQGTFGAKMSDMTNVKVSTSKTAKTTTDATLAKLQAGTVYYNDLANGKDCLVFKVTKTDGNLIISKGSGTSTFCKGLQDSVANLIKTHEFGGSSISFN